MFSLFVKSINCDVCKEVQKREKGLKNVSKRSKGLLDVRFVIWLQDQKEKRSG